VRKVRPTVWSDINWLLVLFFSIRGNLTAVSYIMVTSVSYIMVTSVSYIRVTSVSYIMVTSVSYIMVTSVSYIMVTSVSYIMVTSVSYIMVTSVSYIMVTLSRFFPGMSPYIFSPLGDHTYSRSNLLSTAASSICTMVELSVFEILSTNCCLSS
jgi:hypothetical protein